MHAALVRVRPECNHIRVGFIEALHHALVAADDQRHLVFLHEAVYAVRAEALDELEVEGVVLVVRAVLHLLLRERGVRPEDLQGQAVQVGFGVVDDLQRPRDQVDFLDVLEQRAQAAVHAENALLHDRRQRHLLEDAVDALVDRVLVVDVLVELLRALVRQALGPVDAAVLVVAAEQVDLVLVAQLQREEHQDDLQTARAAVDVVAQKEVVEAVDVAVEERVVGRPEGVEQAHQVQVLAVDVAEDLDRRAHLQHHLLALEELHHLLTQDVDLVALYVGEEVVVRRDGLVVLGAQQRLEEGRVDALQHDGLVGVRVLVLEAHAQLLVLLLQLVDGHLLDYLVQVLVRLVGHRHHRLVRQAHVLLVLVGVGLRNPDYVGGREGMRVHYVRGVALVLRLHLHDLLVAALAVAAAAVLGLRRLDVHVEALLARAEHERLHQHVLGLEDARQVHAQHHVRGHVGRVLVEAAVDVEVVLDRHRGVPEALDGRELVPVRALRVVDLEGQHLAHLVAAAADHEHQRAHEERRVLRFGCYVGVLRSIVKLVHPKKVFEFF